MKPQFQHVYKVLTQRCFHSHPVVVDAWSQHTSILLFLEHGSSTRVHVSPPVHPEQRESLEFLTSTMSSSHIMIQRTSSIHPSILHLFLHSSLRLSRGVMDAFFKARRQNALTPRRSVRSDRLPPLDWQEMRWCHDECGRCLFYTDELEDDCSCAASQMWSMMMSGNWALLQKKKSRWQRGGDIQ